MFLVVSCKASFRLFLLLIALIKFTAPVEARLDMPAPSITPPTPPVAADTAMLTAKAASSVKPELS